MSTAKKIRVAYVINDLLMGGAQSMVLALTSKLDVARFEPVVYYLNDYPVERANLKMAFEQAGVTTIYIGISGKTSWYRAVPRLHRLFKEHRPDVVHVHLIDASIAGIMAGVWARVPKIILHEHQTHRLYSLGVRSMYGLLRLFVSRTVCFSPIIERELFGAVHVVTTPSDIGTSRSCTIANGIDTQKLAQTKATLAIEKKREALGIPQDAVVVISVARLISWKGQRQLLEAFAVAAKSSSSLVLLLAGEGPLLTELEKRAQELDVAGRVHFLGARTDVYELLAMSDIGALALVYDKAASGESIGIAGLEMMGAGLPLIASDYPSAHEIVNNGADAILVPPGNSEALAHALVQLAQDKDMRVRIGTAGRDRVLRTLSWDRIVPLYEHLYELS